MQPSRAVSWALAPLLLLCLACGTDSRPLLAAPDAPQCGNPAEHCKPKGAACTLQTISECIPPYKCRGGVCSEVPTSAAQAAPKSSPDTSPKNSTKEMAASGGEDGSGEDVPAAEATGADGGTACGEPPEHCKPKGADCMLRKVSECVKGLRCDKDTKKCVDRAGGDSKGGDGEGEGEGEGDASQPGDSGEGALRLLGMGRQLGLGRTWMEGGWHPRALRAQPHVLRPLVLRVPVEAPPPPPLAAAAAALPVPRGVD